MGSCPAGFREEVSPVAQLVCEGTLDSRKFSIHFAPEVMERLGSETWMAFKSVPHRGLEIGGILLGRKTCEGDSTTFWIDGFEIVESEHRSGPSYVLSESDWTALQAALTKNGESSIGIYRSNTRSERPALVESDAQLFKRCFDSSEALFLMLAPAAKIATVFTGTNNGNLTRAQELRLSSPIASMMAPRPERFRAHAEQPLLEAPPARLPRIPRQLDILDYAPDASQYTSGRRRVRPIPAVAEESLLPIKARDWAVIIAASCTIFFLTLGTYLYFHRPSRALVPPYEQLHLSVERSGTSLHLLWDRNADSIRAATHGVLHITDGAYMIDRNLSPAMLWEGSFTYEPKSTEETFQLDVYSNAPAGTGVIQVMNPLPPKPAEPNPVKPVVMSPAVPFQAAAPVTHSFTPIGNAAPPATAPVKNIAPVPAVKEDKPDEPPNARALPPVAPEKWRQPAPLVAAASNSFATPVSFPTAAPTVQMFAEPVSGSRVGRLVDKIPLVRRLKHAGLTATPVPLVEARPKVQLSQEARPIAPVAVNVRVRVAESGTVTLAEVEDYGDPPNWRLAAAALDAARRWTFEPARVEDTAVPSDMILHFRFAP